MAGTGLCSDKKKPNKKIIHVYLYAFIIIQNSKSGVCVSPVYIPPMLISYSNACALGLKLKKKQNSE